MGLSSWLITLQVQFIRHHSARIVKSKDQFQARKGDGEIPFPHHLPSYKTWILRLDIFTPLWWRISCGQPHWTVRQPHWTVHCALRYGEIAMRTFSGWPVEPNLFPYKSMDPTLCCGFPDDSTAKKGSWANYHQSVLDFDWCLLTQIRTKTVIHCWLFLDIEEIAHLCWILMNWMIKYFLSPNAPRCMLLTGKGMRTAWRGFSRSYRWIHRQRNRYK